MFHVVILKCAHCGTQFMCHESQVPGIETDGCLCGKKMNFDVVPKELWSKEDIEYGHENYGTSA